MVGRRLELGFMLAQLLQTTIYKKEQERVDEELSNREEETEKERRKNCTSKQADS